MLSNSLLERQARGIQKVVMQASRDIMRLFRICSVLVLFLSPLFMVALSSCGEGDKVVLLQDVGTMGDGICLPNCLGKFCGDDGCGGDCGTCDTGKECDETGRCICAPNCDDKVCGSDGCGGICGICAVGEDCIQGTGVCECTPDCKNRECGTDGCNDSCGICLAEEQCSDAGKCVPIDAPSAPSDLTAIAVSTSQIDIAWVDNSDDEKGFKVERSEDGANFAIIKNLNPNVVSFQNGGLQKATTYYYRVRAYHDGGDSAATNMVDVSTMDTVDFQWSVETIDSEEGFGAVTKGVAIAVDNAKNQHVVFVTDDGFLRYATRTNTNDAIWDFGVVDEGPTQFPAIYGPKKGEIHISYTAKDPSHLAYASLDDNNKPWKTELVDKTSSNTGHASSIYAIGDEVFISYVELSADGNEGDVRFAKRSEDELWSLYDVDDITFPDPESYTSLVASSNGTIHVSYHDFDRLFYNQLAAGVDDWDPFTATKVHQNNSEEFKTTGTSVGLDNKGKAHVIFTVSGSAPISELRHATNETDSWKTAVVDTVEKSHGIRLARAVVDKSNFLHVAYLYDSDGVGPLHSLRYATNRSGEWKTYDADTESKDITHTYLAMDSSGTPYIAYIDADGDKLKIVKGKP